jgi:hypothetical protein
MNPDLDAAGVPTVLSICVLLFTARAWTPIILRRPISPAALSAALSLTVSSLLQMTFIFLVWKQVLTLDYSLKFAALGAPFCVLALLLVRRDKQPNEGARDLRTGSVSRAGDVDALDHDSLAIGGRLMRPLFSGLKYLG